ncbi:hypothetical protein Tco_1502895 [Tanacetum coccineum]
MPYDDLIQCTTLPTFSTLPYSLRVARNEVDLVVAIILKVFAARLSLFEKVKHCLEDYCGYPWPELEGKKDLDWLSKRKFVIVCHEKVVRIPLEGDEILWVHSERTQGVVKTLMNTKAGKSDKEYKILALSWSLSQ